MTQKLKFNNYFTSLLNSLHTSVSKMVLSFRGILIILFFALISTLFVLKFSVKSEILVHDRSLFPACRMHHNLVESCDKDTCSNKQRVVVIGDVHGSAHGLFELLHWSNITLEPLVCEWKIQEENVILVQVGDIVDRGAYATEAWNCLRYLQESAPAGSKVIRLVGNHELWWLGGHYHQKHDEDSYDKVKHIVLSMKDDILSGKMKAAFSLESTDVSLLFVHAGIRPHFFQYMQQTLQDHDLTGEEVAVYMNELLHKHTRACPGFPRTDCSFSDELFEAGSDRGGRNIGGPFWTDFSVLEKAAKRGELPNNIIQVVGHTAVHCDGPENCPNGLVRTSSGLLAVCVDGGMYYGNRGFLEISGDGIFRSFEKKSQGNKEWNVRDISAEFCQQAV